MKTAVFVCADAANIRYTGPDVAVIEGLCDSPTRLADRIGTADRVVLLLHQARYDLAEVQKALRSVEIDPLGAQILEVPPSLPDTDLEVAVAGLRKRAMAFAGSHPEQAKPVPRGDVTRRGLFRPPQPVYLAAPMVDHGVCAAADGCRACADVCPQGAYQWRQGRIHFNKDICEPCGRCVSACPTEAISNPAATPTMLAAQIKALVGDAPVALRFVCSRAHLLEPEPNWHDVVVPCTGMIPGSWLVTALLMGAAAATAVTCTDSGCPLELDEHTRMAIDFARSALATAALDHESVPTAASGDAVNKPIAGLDFANPFTHAGDIEAMLQLDSLSDEILGLTHPGATLGVVAVAPDACTLCAQCAQTCPTGAIVAEYEGDVVSLTFDAMSCTNCRQCMIACPEIERGAIGVEGCVDTQLLRAGRQTVNEGTVLVCESCSKPIAPSSMMDRIGELLGDEFDDTMSYLTRRCIDCRGLS
jgi:ferredoxin